MTQFPVVMGMFRPFWRPDHFINLTGVELILVDLLHYKEDPLGVEILMEQYT
jgi:hypothetical protein